MVPALVASKVAPADAADVPVEDVAAQDVPGNAVASTRRSKDMVRVLVAAADHDVPAPPAEEHPHSHDGLVAFGSDV